ncbi:hypothetical protein I302_108616 [Kwoniella bestiolae CBS 10118]|uniref:Uncharacterized protein n=1 Tax=Kwoniella bestiolae CBS 10118 TaxID=1296100 RepID=A0A1B9FTM6_9TREE|nr:hypothetical protein I302_07754 [Kwoniella bestiolae CBS 10118]OCF22112.1 hypothetical protein I302_07754 [Kwoniella bestiolae CBS 10118]
MSNKVPDTTDYTFYRTDKPLPDTNIDPDEWRVREFLNTSPFHSTHNNHTQTTTPPYGHPNPFSPNTFPRYGYYPTQGMFGIYSNPFSSSTPFAPPPPPPPPRAEISPATKQPFIFPSMEQYQMYAKDTTLFFQSTKGWITDPCATSSPIHKPFGDTSDLIWTSPRTGKTYQLPAMHSRYAEPHHYVCVVCEKRKMKFDGFTWCKKCRDNTKSVVVYGE